MTRRFCPKFTNDLAVAEIRIGVKEFECVGVSPPHDHPHIYLNMGENRSMRCPYCSTLFVFDPALEGFDTAPAGCYFADEGGGSSASGSRRLDNPPNPKLIMRSAPASVR